MQTCYNCGKQVSDETLICPDCGALVRRYTTPVNPAVNPAPVQSVPAVPGAVPPPAGGKLRLRGAVKVWLIIECVLCGYMAFSALCAGLLAGNPQAMEMMFSQSGAGMSMLAGMEDSITQAQPLFFVLCLLFAAKLACHLWLLLRPRRLAFYVSIGVSLLSLLCCLVPMGSATYLIYFLDPIFTWLGLRRFWAGMRV